jgi:hypothetical protein
MKSLRTQLEAMRAERTKLLSKLAEETSRLKSDCFAHDNELTDLRQREYRATESARKLKKAYDFQKALLQKRIEQNHQARVKIRQLLLALKKQRSSSFSDDLLEDIQDMSELNDMSDGISDSSERIIENTERIDNNSENTEKIENNTENNEDEEVMLQLNEQTEAVLNEEINMMDIDPVESGYSQESKESPTKVLYPNSVNFSDSQTGEMPRSALRHSPLVSRRRDVFAKLEENKKNPFQ